MKTRKQRTPSKTPNPFLFALYRSSLHLYPWRLRLLYQDQFLQTACDAYADSSSSLSFWLSLFADLLKSAIKEHLLMIREQVIARPIFFHALTIGLILTLMGGSASLTFQQMLRRGANQPQIQMAASYASQIASGVRPNVAIPPNNVDLEQSLEPFAIFYDDQGVPLAANGYLNKAIPSPPPGVFSYLRTHGTDTVTWQPQPNVRIAAVMHRVPGPTPGFILAGRSLRLVEEQESLFWRVVFMGWFMLVFLLVAGAALLSRFQRGNALPA
ncbi:MAG TPA: hypothetical protein VH117_08440 [Edaphobacter sp.]|jgi:hypothetical protein|nr:hypothetical protein [Edaphobacter sp.]